MGYLREGGLWHCLGSLVGCKVRASLSRRVSPMYAEAVSHSPVLNAASYECSADRGAERQHFRRSDDLADLRSAGHGVHATHTSLLRLVQRLAPLPGLRRQFPDHRDDLDEADVTPCKTAMVETRAGLRPSTLPRTESSPSDAAERGLCRSFLCRSSRLAWRSPSRANLVMPRRTVRVNDRTAPFSTSVLRVVAAQRLRRACPRAPRLRSADCLALTTNRDGSSSRVPSFRRHRCILPAPRHSRTHRSSQARISHAELDQRRGSTERAERVVLGVLTSTAPTTV